MGSCGHTEVCWICAVRLRAIVKDFRCPVCKEELNEIYLGNDPNKALKELNKGQPLKGPKEPKLGLVFASESVKEDVERLFDYRCWHQRCLQNKECFPTIEALQRHLETEHGRQFCPTCLQGRKVFLFEQLLYQPNDLKRHHDDGDRACTVGPSLPQSPPHARCNFCKRSFYSEEDLLEHMHTKHQLCGICERQGRKGEFYQDYGYLSVHYEEEHYVCRHENCRREAYRLVAFANEDDLWMHEIKEHSTKLSQKASKRGTRLAMGATSYREVQAEAREARRNTQRTQRSTATLEAVTGQVRFMRTRGQPPAPPESDWPKLQEESGSSGSQVDQARYPPRAVKQQERRATALAAAPAGPAGPATATPAASSRPSRDPVREQHRALAQLLAVAVQRIDQTGIDLVAALEQEEWRAKNRRFKRDLEEQLGPTELQHFKEFSMQYRYNLRDAETSAGQTGSAAAATYAQRVMEVFATTMAKSGEAVAAELLCDLVLLLPDEAPRHLLYQALDDLSRREAAAAAPPAAPATTATAKAPPAAKAAPKAAQAKARSAAKAPVLSRQLEETLEAMPMSRSCRGGRLSFLSALNAVMDVMSAGTGTAPVPLQALRRCVKQLDGQQAESLELMHQHLVDAGGSTLDFEPMDRLLSLRPLLQLKLGSASGSSGADRDRSWWEWKEAAAAAVQRMGVEERKAVQLYVSLASKHLEESGAGYPAKAPPLAPAWEKRKQPSHRNEDFPALPSGQR